RAAQAAVSVFVFAWFSGTRWENRNSANVPLPDAAETRPSHVRLASPPPHVRDELPPAGRRHREALDGARAHTDHDDARAALANENAWAVNPISVKLSAS